ncbi:MAG: rhodanese domain protein [Litorilinea sp.]|nr:MAG: rhodanese domain protein [Litorilinea sp.]
MPNPFGVPELTVQEVAEKRRSGVPFLWLDVREPVEWTAARIDDADILTVPLSELAERQLDALPEALLDREAEIVVFCHHGVRSAQVAAWLRQQGWKRVYNMAGGIDAWAREIDPSVGSY